MKRTGGVLVLLAALGGCQSMEQGSETECPYCGGRFAPYTMGATATGMQVSQASARPAGYAVAQKHMAAPCNGPTGVQQCRHDVVPEDNATESTGPGRITMSETKSSAMTSRTTARQLEQAKYNVAANDNDGPELAAGLTDAPEFKDDHKTARPAGTAASTPGPFPLAGTEHGASSTAGAAAAQVHYFNTKRIVLHYEVKDAGANVAGVDLWYTHDGQKWTRVELPGQQHSPYTLDVSKEGRYGFTLLPRNGSVKMPQPGEQPQIWTEVDMTKPFVKLARIESTEAPDGKHMTILWKAMDKNLGSRPVTLSYAERPNGPWKQIAVNLTNNGRYDWKMPHGLPARFVVRVEASDMAGNVGADQTPRPLVVDASTSPTIEIVGVEPGHKMDK